MYKRVVFFLFIVTFVLIGFGFAAADAAGNDFHNLPPPHAKARDYDEIFDFDQDAVVLDKEAYWSYLLYYKNRYYNEDRMARAFKLAYYKMGAWKPYLIEIFREEFAGSGLPMEIVDKLIYLAIPESHWKQLRSGAYANGYYQFIRQTARDMGLSCGFYAGESCYIDERKDPLLAGRACARYLRELYDMFGCVDLALSRYNGTYAERLLESEMHNGRKQITYTEFLSYLEELANTLKQDIERLDYYPYRVKYGESLSSISRKFRVSNQSVIDANHLKYPYKLRYRMVLQIPIGAHRAKEAMYNDQTSGYRENFRFAAKFWATVQLIEEGFAVDEAPVAVFETMVVQGGCAAQHYTVKKGDTLSSIAAKFKSGVEAIAMANNIDDRDHIKIGQVLVIPGGKGIATLETIAKEKNVSLKRLKYLNQSVEKTWAPLPEGFIIRY